jgi:CubicO group peptidase (beta-lactamase class C family)
LINKARDLILDSWHDQDFDHASLCVFNLKTFENESIEFHSGVECRIENFYYDLASVTKVLGMGALRAKSPELFDEELNLLIEHRGGLPRWAILGTKGWKETVNQYQINESATEYSDLSMLRLMLEIEKKTGKPFKELCSFYWDKELVFWKDLPAEAVCPDTGFRKGSVVNGEVNDDNCFKIGHFCSHAGLFATSEGLLRSLFNLEKEVSLLEKMQIAFRERDFERYLNGWDTVADNSDTLAGIGSPKETFGHLGFTGTSVWIDATSGRGWFLLTNSTKKYWYNRVHLNSLRKKLGEEVWKLPK